MLVFKGPRDFFVISIMLIATILSLWYLPLFIGIVLVLVVYFSFISDYDCYFGINDTALHVFYRNRIIGKKEERIFWDTIYRIDVHQGGLSQPRYLLVHLKDGTNKTIQYRMFSIDIENCFRKKLAVKVPIKLIR